MNYQPDPVDLSDIPIPDKLTPLIEQLAESVHEAWAAERVAQGWIYGPERNDHRKEHPCLVSYDQLPESEKEVDRRTVTRIIRMMLHLGFAIEEMTDE